MDNYNRANIHTLLTEGFSVAELKKIYYDLADFKDAMTELPANPSPDEIAVHLLDFAERRLRIPALLRWAETQNPTRYKHHQPYGAFKLEVARFAVLNFSGRPLLDRQKEAVKLAKNWPELHEVLVNPGNVDQGISFTQIVIDLVDQLDLSAEAWQTYPLVVVPAGYTPVWSILLAELHGRIGHFPEFVRLRPAPSGALEKFEVAEVVDLQDIRNQAINKRRR